MKITYRIWYGNIPGEWNTTSLKTYKSVVKYLRKRQLNVTVEEF